MKVQTNGCRITAGMDDWEEVAIVVQNGGEKNACQIQTTGVDLGFLTEIVILQ